MPLRDLCPTDSYLEGVEENLYGHKRKLRFVLQALESWAVRQSSIIEFRVSSTLGAGLVRH